MLPLRFFRIPTFAAANFVAASVFFAMFGSVFFLALYLQNVRGYSPVGAGLRLFAFSVVILFVAPISGRLSDRFGSRWLMTFGPLLGAIGLALLLRTQVDSPYLTVLLPAFIVLAAGMGMTMTPMTAAVMGSVETRHAGIASAATNTSREIGGVFGIALLGAIVTSAFKRGFLARLMDGGMPRAQASMIVAKAGAGAAAGSTGSGAGNPLVAQAVQGSFVHAIHVGMIMAVVFMVIAALVSAIFVRSHAETPDRVEGGPGGH
jgi:MFS family permease